MLDFFFLCHIKKGKEMYNMVEAFEYSFMFCDNSDNLGTPGTDEKRWILLYQVHALLEIEGVMVQSLPQKKIAVRFAVRLLRRSEPEI